MILCARLNIHLKQIFTKETFSKDDRVSCKIRKNNGPRLGLVS